MELLMENQMTEEVNDYKTDAEIAPKRRGRPKAATQLVVEEAPAPALAEEPAAQEAPATDTYVSPQVALEIEAGRRAIGLK
jgi:hypothetical protein